MAKKNKVIEDKTVIIDNDLVNIMHQSMMQYSEHVILDRALPRVEDGLKPVQRRILYSMNELGITPDKPHKKSARIVGECLGKYHPHGDRSVYDAMVRLAQPFNTRMLLVDGHGNFGSVDGDGAAAMRYTEARLAPIAMEMLRDLDKETVSFSLNFDDSLEEPDVLPCRFPNLLVNGTTGIAVGLATNIPPHNLGEVINGVVAYIDNSRISLDEMMKIIPGPDFPTGGIIVQSEGIKQAYETGKGKITVRANAFIEKDGDKEIIVITEFPYQINKAQLLSKINDLREQRKDRFGFISEISDESDRNGTRAVIRLKKDTNAQQALASLYKYTDLETSCGVNMVAIAGGKPKLMGLLEVIAHYTEFQRQVIYKRSMYDLNIAKKQEHIQQGKLIAVNNIRRVVDIILNAQTDNEAKEQIKQEFNLTERQAVAILEMKLKQLKKVDAKKLEEEIENLKSLIAELDSVLSSKRKQLGIVRKEILEIKKKYADKRRTVILSPEHATIATVDINEKIEKSGKLILTRSGNLKFMTQKSYSMANKGIANCDSGELVVKVADCNNSSNVIGFTQKGNGVVFDIDSLGEDKWKSKGTAISKIAKTDSDERLIVFFTKEEMQGKDLYFYTKNGMVKKTECSEYSLEKKTVSPGIILKEDELVGVELADNDCEYIIMVTQNGMVLNAEADIPLQGRKASGVKGIQLSTGDSLIFAKQHSGEGEIVVATESGLAKRVILSSIDPSKRYRKGLIINDNEKNGAIVFADIVTVPYDIAIELADGECVGVNTDAIDIADRTKKGKDVIKEACKNSGSNLSLVMAGCYRHNI